MRRFEVRPATARDQEAIYTLLAEAGARLAADGYFNWTPPYPRERIAADLAGGVMHLVFSPEGNSRDAPLATYTLRAEPVHSYRPPPWPRPSLRAWYLNRLAVSVAAQGNGVGSWCLEHLRRAATAAKIQAIRCDVLADNRALCAFYGRAGYQACGRRAHSGWEFGCYELRLT